jgi:hypothetical protein
MEYLSIIALILSILGAIYTSSKVKSKRLMGFILWLGSNLSWLYLSLNRLDFIQSILWLFYLLTCVRGIKSNLR